MPSRVADRNSTRVSGSTLDTEGRPIHNEILLALPESEREKLWPNLEFVRLKLQQVVCEPGESLKSAYFCDSGMFSILNVMPDSTSVEVGLVGSEGFVGLPLIAGFRTSSARVIVQADAT